MRWRVRPGANNLITSRCEMVLWTNSLLLHQQQLKAGRSDGLVFLILYQPLPKWVNIGITFRWKCWRLQPLHRVCLPGGSRLNATDDGRDGETKNALLLFFYQRNTVICTQDIMHCIIFFFLLFFWNILCISNEILEFKLSRSSASYFSVPVASLCRPFLTFSHPPPSTYLAVSPFQLPSFDGTDMISVIAMWRMFAIEHMLVRETMYLCGSPWIYAHNGTRHATWCCCRLLKWNVQIFMGATVSRWVKCLLGRKYVPCNTTQGFSSSFRGCLTRRRPLHGLRIGVNTHPPPFSVHSHVFICVCV